ncbi:MAG: hypothetical protein GEV00_05540 [Actinophytocola sp.]|nr:hypothetical protein [Actinophytocola sp.]
MACTGCVDELDHCHGVLVEHHDGEIECTDSGCAAFDPARHAFAQGCDDVLSGCDCVAERELAAVA